MSTSETLVASVSSAEKRRTTRIAKRVPIAVTGTDALGDSFKVVTETVSVSCHGCRYRSRLYVPKNSTVSVEISCAGLPLRIVSGRVVWVQRPRKIKQVFEISLDFDTPENVWDVNPPPEDWLPYFQNQANSTPVPTPAPAPALETMAVPEMKVSVPGGPAALASMPVNSIGPSAIAAASYDITSLEVESRGVQLREAIEKTLDKSVGFLSESAATKIVEQLAGPLAQTIVEKVCREITDKLDERIEKALREAAHKNEGPPATEIVEKVCQQITGKLDERIENALREAVQKNDGPPATEIVEKVCREITGKLDERIENALSEAAHKNEGPSGTEIAEKVCQEITDKLNERIENALREAVQKNEGPSAAEIAEKVCQEITDKLNERIENTLREAVQKTEVRAKPRPRKSKASPAANH